MGARRLTADERVERRKRAAALVDENIETVRDLARAAAIRYCRRCWWADQDDLEQQAMLEVLLGAGAYREEKAGRMGFAGYAWRAMVRGLSGYLWRTRYSFRVPFRCPDDITQSALEDLDAIPELRLIQAEEEADRQRWAARARQAIDEALVDLDDAEEAEVLLSPASSEDRPPAVARRLGIPEASVYALRRAAGDRLRMTPAVHRAWADRPGRT